MAVTDRVAPYAEQLSDNQDAQASIERAVTRARQAYGAFNGKETAKRALRDKRVRRRATQSAAAARDAVVSVVRGRVEEEAKAQRRRRARRLLTAAAVGTGGSLGLGVALRKQKLGLFCGTGRSPEKRDERFETGDTDGGGQATAPPEGSTPVIALSAYEGSRT